MLTTVLDVFIVFTALVAIVLIALDRHLIRSSATAELKSTIADQAKELAAHQLAEERMVERIASGHYDIDENLWNLITDIDFEYIRAHEDL